MTETTAPDEIKVNCSQCSLKNFSVFRGCPTGLLNDIFSHKSLERFRKSEYLILQEEKFKGVYCIQQGMVKVTKSGKKNKAFILWFAGPGDIIGLDAFINDEPYAFSAMATDEVYACFIPDSDFKAILAKDPGFSLGLMKDMCEKINFIEDRITSMAGKKIREQFAEMLLLLAIRNKKTGEGDLAIHYSINDLANLIGTTRNYLYKILSDLSDQKVISMRNRKLLIKDVAGLSHIAAGD